MIGRIRICSLQCVNRASLERIISQNIVQNFQNQNNCLEQINDFSQKKSQKIASLYSIFEGVRPLRGPGPLVHTIFYNAYPTYKVCSFYLIVQKQPTMHI